MSYIDAAASPSEAAHDAAPGSLGRRIVDTFVAPGELFSRLGPTPPWLDVALVSAIVGMLSMLAIPAEVWLNTAREAHSQLEPAARQAMTAETMAKFSRFSVPVTAFVATFLTLFVLSGLLKLIFGVMMKGEATFAEYRGVVAHAGLISTLGGLVTLPIWIMTGDMTTQLSAGLLAPELPKGVLSTLLNSLNVFYLWWAAVMAIGVAAINRRISIGTAAAIVFGAYFAIAALIGLASGR